MVLLLIYYNSSKDKYHYKIVHYYYSNSYHIGDFNSYNHILVNMVAILDKMYIIDDSRKFLKNYYGKKTLKSKICDYLIQLLIDIKGIS